MGTYGWTVGSGSGSDLAACGQGLGFSQGYNGSDFGSWSQSYGLGVPARAPA